jgi:molybdopterin molybdotransferase
MSDKASSSSSSLLPVDAAIAAVLASVATPLSAEMVPLADAYGRTLATDLIAKRAQPPFTCSSMDGYAVRAADFTESKTQLRIIGESAAGHAFSGVVGSGECVRIFTGAALPDGADSVIRQEDALRDADTVIFNTPLPLEAGRFVRPKGLDFAPGDTLLQAGQRLDARRLALAAAMDHAHMPVHRRPRVAILASGDELVLPGQDASADATIASNTFAMIAMVHACGGDVIDLGIAPDNVDQIAEQIAAAQAQQADVLVTLGGASVGDHDLTQTALAACGFSLGFWRVAMRPGRPLIHGKLDRMIVLGLPGNPVSAIVCGMIFLQPLLRALSGDAKAGADNTCAARLAEAMPANDTRQDYIRAMIVGGQDGLPLLQPFGRQDSAMIGTFARADALIVRPALAAAASAGDLCRAIMLPD